MNHGRDFQKLWAQLRSEVTALQAKGYFGDGEATFFRAFSHGAHDP
jgi:hypothetical protein